MHTESLPHPYNPEHVQNLNTISKLEHQGFEGIDVDLETSLFEYDIIWRELEDDYLFVYAIAGYGRDADRRFDRSTLSGDTDVKEDFDWVNWDALYVSLGTDEVTWHKLPLPDKISDLFRAHGYENIFGSSHWEGFAVENI
jgi:hypothetical protein